MRDGWVRASLKRVARWSWSFDTALSRALLRRRGQIPYVLGGSCVRSARCCEQPAIRVGRLVWYLPTLRRLFLWWQERVNGFQLRERVRSSRTFVFRCTHFDWQTRLCDSYDSRPAMCRDYPRALLLQANPEFFPECGHRPVAANAERLLAALEEQNLSQEQRAELHRKLHLLK